jgi:hypothetical protein
LYHTGLPAKSGVGGGIIAVSPGKFGIAVVSPPLDDAGNSVRAQRAIADISTALGGNPYGATQAQPAPTKSTFEIYGFAMLDIGHDFKQINPNWYDTLRLTRLPKVANEFGEDNNTFMGVRQSRLGFRSSTPTALGELKTIFEFELFGTGVDEGQTTFRLRRMGRAARGAGQCCRLPTDVYRLAGMLGPRSPWYRTCSFATRRSDRQQQPDVALAPRCERDRVCRPYRAQASARSRCLICRRVANGD